MSDKYTDDERLQIIKEIESEFQGFTKEVFLLLHIDNFKIETPQLFTVWKDTTELKIHKLYLKCQSDSFLNNKLVSKLIEHQGVISNCADGLWDKNNKKPRLILPQAAELNLLLQWQKYRSMFINDYIKKLEQANKNIQNGFEIGAGIERKHVGNQISVTNKTFNELMQIFHGWFSQLDQLCPERNSEIKKYIEVDRQAANKLYVPDFLNEIEDNFTNLNIELQKKYFQNLKQRTDKLLKEVEQKYPQYYKRFFNDYEKKRNDKEFQEQIEAWVNYRTFHTSLCSFFNRPSKTVKDGKKKNGIQKIKDVPFYDKEFSIEEIYFREFIFEFYFHFVHSIDQIRNRFEKNPINDSATLTLKDIVIPTKYSFIKKLIDEKKDKNKGLLAAILRDLKLKGYYEQGIKFNYAMCRIVSKNTFNIEIDSNRTFYHAAPPKYLDFIPPANKTE